METSVNNKCMAFTSLEQSKKLAEILPIESADMFYRSNGIDVKLMWEHIASKVEYPCWSLAALYYILPNTERISTNLSRGSWKIDTIEYMPNTWWCEYEDKENPTEYFNTSADNPVDACVAMIIKLNELKML